jgi:hypothetical protein
MCGLEIGEAVVASVHERDDVICCPLLSCDVSVSADGTGELCAGEKGLAVALVFGV